MDNCNHDCENCAVPCEEFPVENCTHDCSTCSANCPSKGGDPADFRVKLHELSSVKKVIGVVSGKGGVGKSLVSAMMAVSMQRRNFHSAVLDADVTGPSIPNMFGIKGMAMADEFGIIPARTKTGIDVISANLLLENPADPVVWRGVMISSLVQQFWSEVIWKDVDYMFVDMPPGTGDVPLTVFQSLPVDGIIIVTTPQDLVSMIVSKAVRMAEMMNVPVLGVVENMSYYTCPDCGKQHEIFGASKVQDVAAEFDIPHTARIPIDPVITTMVDAGEIEHVNAEFLTELVDNLEKDLPLEEN